MGMRKLDWKKLRSRGLNFEAYLQVAILSTVKTKLDVGEQLIYACIKSPQMHPRPSY